MQFLDVCLKRIITDSWDDKWGKNSRYHLVKTLCFTGEKTETQERYVTCQRLNNEYRAGIRLKTLSIASQHLSPRTHPHAQPQHFQGSTRRGVSEEEGTNGWGNL